MAAKQPNMIAIMTIALLGFLAVAFGGMFYKNQEEFEKLRIAIRTESVDEIIARGNQGLAQLKLRRGELKEKITALKEETIPDLEKRTNAVAEDTKQEEQRQADALAVLERRAEAIQEKFKVLAALRSEIEENRGRRDIPNLEQRDTFKKKYEEAMDQINPLLAAKQELWQLVPQLIEDAMGGISALRDENQSLRHAVARKEQAIREVESAILREQYDGTILAVDQDCRFLVVDLGRKDHVHKGMRFEVVRWRFSKWNRMGIIELTEINTTTSKAILLDAIQASERRCDLCGYIAKSQDERYCPFCGGGDEGKKVVPLSGRARDEVVVPKKLDPILPGDKISNPIYSKHKVLRFALSGETLYYSTDELRQAILDYGGIPQDEIDVNTDYLVLGRTLDPAMKQEGEEAKARYEKFEAVMKTAKRYGIPVMRERDLFVFIKQ